MSPPIVWVQLDEVAETAWLVENGAALNAAGNDSDGWEASIWILNAMYEADVTGPVPTYDAWRRELIESGVEPAEVIGGVNLEDVTTTTGVTLGFAERPDVARWRRLTWHDLGERVGVTFSAETFPPSSGWFPIKSWPVSIRPPTEGSLDGASLEGLCRVLARFRPGECVALYSLLAAGFREDVPSCFGGHVSDVRALVDPDSGRIGTPSNIWAVDRSWFVYTDWDLSATKVSGPRALIEELEGEPSLETLRWSSP